MNQNNSASLSFLVIFDRFLMWGQLKDSEESVLASFYCFK